MTEETHTFREELERLETVVRELESGDVDLDRALMLFEEGVQHLRVARELLERAELTVKRVVEEADGSLQVDDVDA